jgi:hypothetical protein
MMIAELKGKLSVDEGDSYLQTSEDALTSLVFGCMRYLDWQTGFFDWLCSVEPVQFNGQMPSTALPELLRGSDIAHVRYAFWPTLPNRREPDLALLIERRSGQGILVVVEAKNLSGTSDFELEGAADDYGRTGNQLADQINGMAVILLDVLAEWFSIHETSEIGARIHLFVTAHTRLPVADYKVAQVHIFSPTPVRAFWLSWTSLGRHLQPHGVGEDDGWAALVRDRWQCGLLSQAGGRCRPLRMT